MTEKIKLSGKIEKTATWIRLEENNGGLVLKSKVGLNYVIC